MNYPGTAGIRNHMGQAVVFLCLIVLMVLGFGSPIQADESEEKMVSAYAVYTTEGKVLTYVQDEEAFQKLLNSIETYFSKAGEGEKLVSVEFSQPLLSKAIAVPKSNVKTATEALGIVVKNMKSSTPALTVTVTKEVAREEEMPYETEYRENDTMYEGTEKNQREGRSGIRYIEGMIIEENGQNVATEIVKEDIILMPITEVIEKGTKPLGTATPAAGKGELIVPTNGGYLSSGFGMRGGRMHNGIDIARPNTYTIVAANTGRVIFAGNDGDYGNKVVIDHENGMKTVYAHLASITVKKGQMIEQGKRIGVMGKTGWATGVHLHFEVIVNGSYKNPTNYISL